MPSPNRLLVLFFFGISLLGNAQTPSPSTQKEASLIWALLEQHHVSPKKLDDAFSAKVFAQLIEVLDPRTLYFTASDIQEISQLKDQIDDDIKGKSWKVLPTISALYREKLQKAKATFSEILLKPLDLKKKEFMVFAASDTFPYAASETVYLKRWNKWLRYQTLSKMYAMDKTNSITETNLAAKETEARGKVLATENRNIKKILEHPDGFEAYMASLFFNTLLYTQDPHSYYLSVTDYQNMKYSLSPQALSFGMDLEEDEMGNIVIDQLQPGGPAWRSNQLHKGDILLQMKWEGKEEIDLSGASKEEVNSLLSSSNSSKLEILVKKPHGETQTIGMVKEKLSEGQNIVRSFILKGEKTIGYISLPGFYTEWENTPNSGCANDVASEIVTLKQEGIQGLILDIRYNGGGSLQEGLDLAGIFIQEGPLSILKTKEEKPMVAKDLHRGTVYDGPLLVMVNKQSASASELVAAALQDYHRAVIVGSTTFGKGTGQSIYPLDTAFQEGKHMEGRVPKWGFSAITFFKLFRLTGKSVQKKGLQPDIYLPDLSEWVDYGESAYPTALSNDSIIKKVYYTPLPSPNLPLLAEKSKNRIKQQKFFQLLLDEKEAVVESKSTRVDSIPLHYKEYEAYLSTNREWWKTLEMSQNETTSPFTVNSTAEAEKVMSVDAYAKEIGSSTATKIKQDSYLKESYLIVLDMINLASK